MSQRIELWVLIACLRFEDLMHNHPPLLISSDHILQKYYKKDLPSFYLNQNLNDTYNYIVIKIRQLADRKSLFAFFIMHIYNINYIIHSINYNEHENR